MWANDSACKQLGIEITDIGPGRARLEMVISGTMANGFGMCHGGFIFALADSAFAYACNTHGEKVVAAQGSITYLRPGSPGERLVAVAQERARMKRSGIYDVNVATADGTTVAEFRGHSRVIGPSDHPAKAAQPDPGRRTP
ncbi:MAG: hydroxyphenylacetyl-CoA thioesterase PaaI [Acetobacteraceae bacterium]|nr:hydroxyphenylacetyl-CoA thioesterase PaaI [Acetobacteraceae bacterium]